MTEAISRGISGYSGDHLTEEKAVRLFEESRWGGKPVCPHCGSFSVSSVVKSLPMSHRCRSCRKHFSVRTGSFLEESRLPLKKWLLAIDLLGSENRSVSSVQMAERLAITQKSAWRLRRRIREAMSYRGVSVYEHKALYETRGQEFGALPLLKAILSPPNPQEPSPDQPLRFVDLFCGIGGFHVAGTNLGLDPVFACDIDENARATYRANFGIDPAGDITAIGVNDIPDHDLLFAGFPCQPFSIIGNRRAFADPRGTLWFELVRIIEGKRPRGLVLENVKQLTTVSRGSVIRQILKDLSELGYSADFRVLNALDFGLPQKRERTIIVAALDKFGRFPWPTEPVPMKPLSDILEQKPHPKYYASERIRLKRQAAHQSIVKPAIWHENKAGNVSSHPWACALRAGASYNYLLVDGERRLTPREMLRLQGFPDEFMIVCNDSQTRKQVGNAVPVPMVETAIKGVLHVLQASSTARICA